MRLSADLRRAAVDNVRAGRHGYMVGRNRRRSGEVFDYIQGATGEWTECPAGITAREGDSAENAGSGSRVKKTRRARFHRPLGRARGIRASAARQGHGPRAHQPRKAGAANRQRTAQSAREGRCRRRRILTRNHGHRYYGCCYENGVFNFFEHPVHFVREQAYEGKYVIQTEEPNLSAVEAVRLYRELSEVERAFANLKDVIDLRPIYHRTDDRVQAHIFVAALAFLLHRAIEKKLKAAGIDLSATQALTALKSVRIVEIDLGNKTTKRSVTRGTQRAASVLRALGISELDPPAPPKPGQIIM
jgi:Transposase DDE domain